MYSDGRMPLFHLLAMITLSFCDVQYSDGTMPLFHLLAMITLSFCDIQQWYNAAVSSIGDDYAQFL